MTKTNIKKEIMNKRSLSTGLLAVLLILGFSCTKQNMPEPNEVKPMLQRSEEYYANLRAYKKSDHQMAFGWFGGTGGKGSPDVPGVLDAIPDSMDIVSLWGGQPPLGSYNHELLKKTQEKKGTRFVMVWFFSGIANLMQKNFPNLPVMDAIDNVAKSIADTINTYNLDGFDIDYEPSEAGERNTVFGSSQGTYNNIYVTRALKALSKYLGPLSGTDKLLIVDGYYNYLSPEAGNCLSYAVTQAYGTGSPSSLQSRFNSASAWLPTKKFIVTENFESFWKNGGVNYQDPVYGTIPSLLGMAYWQPTQGRKGGAGSYHAEYEYALNPDYYYMRRAIQIMNPAVR